MLREATMGKGMQQTKRGLLRWFVRRPARIAVASFAAAILLGAALLSSPMCSPENPVTGRRHWSSFVDALFTATSAVCVTGLTVKDTGTEWSLFGQFVILALIQTGGLGIMTVYALLASMVLRRLSMRLERVMGDVVAAGPRESVWGTVKFICLLTGVVELVGAAGLYLSWRGHFDEFWKCLYFSVFHAISAFCNAGFGLYRDSLVRYRGDVAVNMVICMLIVLGGLGFLVIRDLKDYFWARVFQHRGKRLRLSTHSKLVLAVTGLLLLLGFVGVFVMESAASLRGVPLKERILAAMFQSVTARTAGFNTIDLSPGSIAPSTALLLIVLMFIGGSPASTAGGVKTTTVGVMIASSIATLRGTDRAEVFHHSVPQVAVHRVASIILLSLTALLSVVFLLLITEAGAQFLPVAFESTSAFGTVGLSMGITPQLTLWGRLILPALMFIGRLGPVTIVMSAAAVEGRIPYRYPTEEILVG